MKKVFFVAGELSGDKLAAWYLEKIKKEFPRIKVCGIGGIHLAVAGAEIYADYRQKLNVAGIFEILKHLLPLKKFLDEIVTFVAANKFDSVVLVDFPGFNLRLARLIKKASPGIQITYLSPPQLWVWGAWRVKSIKKFCDKIVVIYPLEIGWYKNRGVKNVVWLGYPFYNQLQEYFEVADRLKERLVAVIPGSRKSEVENLFPIFLNVFERIASKDKSIKAIVPMAESVELFQVEKKIAECENRIGRGRIKIVRGEREKMQALAQCCLAITKPGTITLELALLGVPAIVAYKTSWLSYFLGKLVVKVRFMGLPNLLLDTLIYKEFIQEDCCESKIYEEASRIIGELVDVPRKDSLFKIKADQLRKILSA